jgi:hypothetical protein
MDGRHYTAAPVRRRDCFVPPEAELAMTESLEGGAQGRSYASESKTDQQKKVPEDSFMSSFWSGRAAGFQHRRTLHDAPF